MEIKKKYLVAFYFFLALSFFIAALIQNKNGADESPIELKYFIKNPGPSPITSLFKDHLVLSKTIYFLDTQNLDLFKNGIILRTRINDNNADTVIKIRPGLTSRKQLELLSQRKMKLEVDRVAGENIASIEMSSKLRPGDASKFVIKERPKKLFNKSQRKILQEVFADAPKNLFKKLIFFGPIYSETCTVAFEQFKPKVTIESWQLGDGPQRTELSFMSTSKYAKKDEAQFLQILKDRQITEFENITKTEWALKALSSNFEQ